MAKKVLMATEVYLPTINGVVSSIATNKSNLEKLGWQVLITAPRTVHKNNPKGELRIRSIALPGNKDYRLSLPSDNDFQLALDFDPKIIHCHHIFKIGIFGLKIAKKLNRPSLLTYHTLLTSYIHHLPVIGQLLPEVAQRYLIARSKRVANLFDHVVAPSKPMAKILKSWGVIRPISVIPTGVELNKFETKQKIDIRQKLGLTKPTKILLWLGRLAREKNLSLLLSVWPMIQKDRHDRALVIAGDGPERQELENQVKSHDLTNIYFTGFAEESEVGDYFRQSDILVFPSITETQGLVVAEAMSQGLVPVAINQMGPVDVIQDGQSGLLVEKDVNAFAAACLLLLNNQKLAKRLSVQARERAKLFKADKMAKKLSNLYDRLIKEKAER